MCCLGNFQTHLMYTFVYRLLIGHLANRDRWYSTMTKEVNLLLMRLSLGFKRLMLPSVGTVDAAILTTSSLSACGTVSSMRRSISTTMTPWPRLGVDWETILTFTINSGFINRLIIEHPTRCISNNIRCLTLTQLTRFYTLNLRLFCLKDGGKLTLSILWVYPCSLSRHCAICWLPLKNCTAANTLVITSAADILAFELSWCRSWIRRSSQRIYCRAWVDFTRRGPSYAYSFYESAGWRPRLARHPFSGAGSVEIRVSIHFFMWRNHSQSAILSFIYHVLR